MLHLYMAPFLVRKLGYQENNVSNNEHYESEVSSETHFEEGNEAY